MITKITLIVMLLMTSLAVQAQTMMNIHQSNGTVLQIPLNTIDSITYTMPNPGNLATITTLPIDDITDIAATTGGNITNDGGTPITQRGVVWSTSPNPTTANNSATSGSGTGSFTCNIMILTASTTYLRACIRYQQRWNSLWKRVNFYNNCWYYNESRRRCNL